MGKNQAYKAMQRSRLGSSSAAPDEVEDGMDDEDCGCSWVDSSFHSPEWHAARLASLKTSHTITWEEYKKRQKEEEVRKGELEADKDRMMREYRAQLDAERAHKLAHGKNHSSRKSSRKRDRDKDLKKSSSKKRKHSRQSDLSSHSESETSSSDDDERESKRSKSRLKRRKKEKKHGSSRSKHSSSENEEGPLPLSKFFGNNKS